MTRADKKVIEQNPGLSPYDLLEKGLSEKGYEELVSQQGAEKQKIAPTVEKTEPEPQKVAPKVEQLREVRATPTLSPVQSDSGELAWLVSPDGKKTRMSRSAAERFIRKNVNYKTA